MVKNQERLELTLCKPERLPNGVTALDNSTYRITLTRPSGGGFGLKLGGSDEPGVALLAAVGPTAQEAGVGRLEGLEAVLVSINGMDVSNQAHDAVVGILQQSDYIDMV